MLYISSPSLWSNLTWDEALPYGDDLPDNQGTDSGADMTGNVLLMHFNQNPDDGSGLGNNGAIAGNVANATGKFNGAYSFDGSDDYITITDSDSLDATTALTIAMWINRGMHM